MKIVNQEIDVNIEEELRQFEWTRARWTDTKLQAASPFRYDEKPSFFVNLTGQYAGTWADSGAYDSEWASGNFVKLLAFLRQETYEETEDYLLQKYGIPADKTQLKMRLPPFKIPEKIEYLADDIITPAISRYLLSRGISGKTQRVYGVGYGRQKGFVAIGWRTPSGQLANVMYRSTRGKLFFYERGGLPRRKLVYGIDVVRHLRPKTIAICEAPIDAMSWYEISSGNIVGVATGGVTLSDEQADLIKRSNVETIILSGDNDKAGAKFNMDCERKLRGYVRILGVDYGDKKDMNEILISETNPNIISFYRYRK